MLRGGWSGRASKRLEDSNRGDRGDCGRIAGEERGDGILGVGQVVDRGERERTGESARDEAVVELCFWEPEAVFVCVVQSMGCSRTAR